MLNTRDICTFLESIAPNHLAEEWDNVGLLVGDNDAPVTRLMTCLTATPSSVAEAIRERVDLIVAHHPLPFRPLKRLTTSSTPGRLLLRLIGAGIGLYSPHTAFDSAAEGINQRFALGLDLENIVPLLPADPAGGEIAPGGPVGAGRVGEVMSDVFLDAFADRVCSFLGVEGLHVVGNHSSLVRRVAIGCGSAGTFLDPARQAGCDLLVTGEATFHTCLEAEANGVALILAGHYASERFGVEHLARTIADQFPGLKCWASRDERDPIAWFTP